MFIYFWERETETETETETEHEPGRSRGKDTESEAGSRLGVVSTEPDAGLELMGCEIMSWAEVVHLTDWTTHAPLMDLKVDK